MGNPIIQEEIFSNMLHCLDPHKFMRPDEIHPRILRELVEVLNNPLSIIYQRFSKKAEKVWDRGIDCKVG